MKKTTKIIIILVFCLSVALNIIFITKDGGDLQFPIKYTICDKNYEGCFISAKFKDVQSCQLQVEKGSWYCDQTNPDNIQCRVPKPGESFATSFCME